MSNKQSLKRLADVRAAIEAAQADLERLPNRPIPAAEAIERANAWVDSKAAAFNAKRRASAFVEATPRLALDRLLNIDAAEVRIRDFQADPSGVLAWLFGDQLKAKLVAEIETLEILDPLPLAKRRAEQERLESDIQRLEIEEESILRAFEQTGETIDRRKAADLAVVLAPDSELNTSAWSAAA